MTVLEYYDAMSEFFNVRITQKELNHMFDLYREATGSVEVNYPSLSAIGVALVHDHHFEYRAGSKWSGHSKFVIDKNGIIFSPNCAPKGRKEQREIKKASHLFEKKIKTYLWQLEQLKEENYT